MNNSQTRQLKTVEMALGYPSHDNVTRMHKLFPKVAREPLLLLSIDFKISAEHKGAMCYDSYKNTPKRDCL